MPTYKRLLDVFTGLVNPKLIRRLDDNADIPVGSGNRDDLEYQAWLAAGNTPLDPDPAPTAADMLAAVRAAAIDRFNNDASDDAERDRAIVLALVDVVNMLFQRDRDRTADMVAAGTFAAFKTAWTARPALPVFNNGTDITPAQARTFIANKINSGNADKV